MAAYTTVKKPTDYFNTKLYSGSNGTQNVTGVGFQPDWIWLKCRTAAYHHRLFDAVRGVNKNMRTNSTDAEQDIAEGITAFASDGFSVTQGSNLEYNASGQTYVSWNWKAGGAASSNSDGTIASQVSVNTTAGFSIVTYTGNGTGNSTIGHGLGAIPDFIIVKRRDTTQSWGTKNPAFNSAADPQVLYMNTTQAGQTDTNVWGTSAAFTNQTFTVGDWTGSNANGGTYVAYCFKEVRGYSKFGTYTGTGNADGTFIYTGFRPAWGMFKKINGTSDWMIIDDARNGGYRDQPVYKPLLANTTAAESSSYASYQCDFVSTGFKIRNTLGNQNSDGDRYFYMAFAELPLVGDAPVTAR